ncbi:MAG: FlgD immunoglobulin-like domain containing protein [Candidatus Eisenbacteria bacterium]
MKILLALMTSLLLVSAASAGVNGGVSPYVKTAGGMDGALTKDSPYLEVRVGGQGFVAVNAVHVDVEHGAGLEFVDFTAGDLFADPLVLGPFDRTDRSVVDVTTATLTGAVSSPEGEVGVIRFRVVDESDAEVRIVSFQTADDSWQVETQVSYENPVTAGGAVPTTTRLLGNVPNPFNPVTEIRFDLSNRVPVSLEVYNVSGQRVRTLSSGALSAGSHAVTWDGRDDGGASVSSGVYFYRLQAGEFSESKRMTLIR